MPKNIVLNRRLLTLHDVASAFGLEESPTIDQVKRLGIPVTYILGPDEPRVLPSELEQWISDNRSQEMNLSRR